MTARNLGKLDLAWLSMGICLACIHLLVVSLFVVILPAKPVFAQTIAPPSIVGGSSRPLIGPGTAVAPSVVGVPLRGPLTAAPTGNRSADGWQLLSGRFIIGDAELWIIEGDLRRLIAGDGSVIRRLRFGGGEVRVGPSFALASTDGSDTRTAYSCSAGARVEILDGQSIITQLADIAPGETPPAGRCARQN